MRRQSFNTAQEFQDRQSALQPLLDMVRLCNLEFLFHVECAQLITRVISKVDRIDFCVPQVGPIATHPDLEKGIWRVIDEDGSVKDSAVSLYFHSLHSCCLLLSFRTLRRNSYRILRAESGAQESSNPRTFS